MDKDGRQRYFILGSVFMEVVVPVFNTRLANEINSRLGSLSVKSFQINLPHRNKWFSISLQNSVHNEVLPLNERKWNLLTVKNSEKRVNCHCKYTAKPIQLEDIDITLTSLFLLNCCNLEPADKQAICALTCYKNYNLSRNIEGSVSKSGYDFAETKTHVLQLDNSKGDDLIRIENRPMDEILCNKYMTCLLDIYQQLEEMGASIHELNDLIQRNNALPKENNELLQAVQSSVLGKNALLQELVNSVRDEVCLLCRQAVLDDKRNSFKLGGKIFYFHHLFELSEVRKGREYPMRALISDILMIDNGRLVICLPQEKILFLCNTDGSQTDSITLQYKPWSAAAVDNSTVAVIALGNDYIEMYNINNKHRLKSIHVPGCWWRGGMCTLNNKLLVVASSRELYIIDPQTSVVVKKIECSKDSCVVQRGASVHTCGDQIFYTDDVTNKLYCYGYNDDMLSTTPLPSTLRRITSLQDGTLIVLCDDGCVYHVSPDAHRYEKVTGLISNWSSQICITYNRTQRKLIACNRHSDVYVFHEI